METIRGYLCDHAGVVVEKLVASVGFSHAYIPSREGVFIRLGKSRCVKLPLVQSSQPTGNCAIKISRSKLFSGKPVGC